MTQSFRNSLLDVLDLLNSSDVPIQRGSDDDQDGYTPLHHACFKGHGRVVRFLLQTNADVNAANNRRGFTPLHIVCQFPERVDIAGALIENGADVNIATARNATALHYACRTGEIPLVRLLVENGARSDVRNHEEFTPLHIVCGEHPGRVELIELLLQGSADVNAANMYGNTPLHYACGNGDQAAVKLLLENGAKQVPNKQGRTPFHVACEKGEIEVLELMQMYKLDAEDSKDFEYFPHGEFDEYDSNEEKQIAHFHKAGNFRELSAEDKLLITLLLNDEIAMEIAVLSIAEFASFTYISKCRMLTNLIASSRFQVAEILMTTLNLKEIHKETGVIQMFGRDTKLQVVLKKLKLENGNILWTDLHACDFQGTKVVDMGVEWRFEKLDQLINFWRDVCIDKTLPIFILPISRPVWEIAKCWEDAKPLGKGSYGFVKECMITGSKRAVKRFGNKKEMLDELDAALTILGKNCFLQCVGYAEGENEYDYGFLIYDLCDKTLLEEVLQCQSVFSALSYALQISNAMWVLHDHIGRVHRDLKLENILLKDDEIIIADLGLCRNIASVWETSGIKGTQTYRSPELLKNPTLEPDEANKVYRAADVYAFGLILWSILHHRTPWSDNEGKDEFEPNLVLRGDRPPIDVSLLSCKLSAEMVELMKKCWHQTPEVRPSFGELRLEFARLCQIYASHEDLGCDC